VTDSPIEDAPTDAEETKESGGPESACGIEEAKEEEVTKIPTKKGRKPPKSAKKKTAPKKKKQADADAPEAEESAPADTEAEPDSEIGGLGLRGDKAIIYNYMKSQNRPYSGLNVFDNLRGSIRKNDVIKHLDELSEEGHI
jgi:hypothetical protein